MPAALTETMTISGDAAIERKRWSVDDLAGLERSGLLDIERHELIRGELIVKASKGRPRSNHALMLYWRLADVFGREFVQWECPIVADAGRGSLPEPDVVVFRRPCLGMTAFPDSSQVLLAAEVSVSTLLFDLTVKAEIYAAAGIPEYWVADIEGRRMIVHREPVDGHYASVLVYTANESVSPLAAPHASLRLFAD